MEAFKRLTHCLACGGDNLVKDIDMGHQPLVNNLKDSSDQGVMTYELIVNECQECSHKQLSIAVDPKILFSNYLYKSGTSETHINFFKKFCETIGPPECWTRILDIGCNDGSMLAVFKEKGWQCYGIEPANHLAAEAMMKGLHITGDFFPTKHAFNNQFHYITAFNVFAHNSNPALFLKEMVKLLEPSGKIYILTTPSRVDNFYHEHVSYFTPKSMMTLAERCGMEVSYFKQVSMHGVSYLFEIKRSVPQKELSPLMHKNPFVGYGAAASGIVIINYLGIDLEYVIDDNSLKQGKFIPTCGKLNIPIFDSSHIEKDDRDLSILILAHHLFDEVVAKIKSLRPNRNDQFIHPIKGAI